MHLNFLLNSFLLFFTPFFLLGQVGITGTVIDGDFNEPLPFANILIKETGDGVTSDFDGKYSLKASAGDILVYSFLGMKEIELTVGNSNTYDVVMTEDAASLDEVIVVAYGSQGKKKLASSVVSIDTEIPFFSQNKSR